MRNKKLIALLSVVAALVLFIVVCGATFLVRHVEAHNEYVSSPDYDAEIVAASGIKNNSSIFFIDESAVKRRIETAYANVGVTTIERKFNDRVIIHYIVYDNMFQYRVGGAYYQCYSSGRIGGTTVDAVKGKEFFEVKPRDAVETQVGAYFQSSDGYDYRLINAFIDYLHTTALTDKQIVERVEFIDLSRDGYFYIRTHAGCSLEIRGTGDGFEALLDNAWSAFAYPDRNSPINQAAGTITVYANRADPDHPEIRTVYDAEKGDAYYKANYM